jgi:hypothetical protein
MALRPFGWQERETRQWLASLSLDVLPHEEEAPFLSNPLRYAMSDHVYKIVFCIPVLFHAGMSAASALCQDFDVVGQ